MISELPILTPATRFSNRAENYVKYRPAYPPNTILFIEKTFKLHQDVKIADIGSGTGLFAEPLLQKGYEVVCIEPNEEMRKAGMFRLGHYCNFTSHQCRAEATGLNNHCIDLITVAQAFHWLNPIATRREFSRILKPGGNVLLAWNVQKTDTPFLKAYADIRERYRIENRNSHKIEYNKVADFFAPYGFQKEVFPNTQLLNFDALKGQLLSVSSIPLPGHPSYETMISSLVQLFVLYNENGFVRMEFETIFYWGVIS